MWALRLAAIFHLALIVDTHPHSVSSAAQIQLLCDMSGQPYYVSAHVLQPSMHPVINPNSVIHSTKSYPSLFIHMEISNFVTIQTINIPIGYRLHSFMAKTMSLIKFWPFYLHHMIKLLQGVCPLHFDHNCTYSNVVLSLYNSKPAPLDIHV